MNFIGSSESLQSSVQTICWDDSNIISVGTSEGTILTYGDDLKQKSFVNSGAIGIVSIDVLDQNLLVSELSGDVTMWSRNEQNELEKDFLFNSQHLIWKSVFIRSQGNKRHVAAGSRDGSVLWLDVEQQKAIHSQTTGSAFCMCLAAYDNFVVAGTEDGKIAVFDMRQKEDSSMLSLVNRDVFDAVASKGGYVATCCRAVDMSVNESLIFSGGDDGIVKFFDLRKPSVLVASIGVAGQGLVTMIKSSPSGRKVACSTSDGSIHVIGVVDNPSRNVIMTPSQGEICWGIDWNPDGSRLCSAGDDKKVTIHSF